MQTGDGHTRAVEEQREEQELEIPEPAKLVDKLAVLPRAGREIACGAGLGGRGSFPQEKQGGKALVFVCGPDVNRRGGLLSDE